MQNHEKGDRRRARRELLRARAAARDGRVVVLRGCLPSACLAPMPGYSTVSYVGRVRPPPCPPPNQPSLDADSVNSIMLVAYSLIALAVGLGGLYAFSQNPHAKIWLRVKLFKLGLSPAIHQATAVPQAEELTDDDREAGLTSSRGRRAKQGRGEGGGARAVRTGGGAPQRGSKKAGSSCSFQAASGASKAKPGRANPSRDGGDGSKPRRKP